MTLQTLSIVIQVVAIFFAISFHESSHAWMALKFGDPTARDEGRISLNPLRHIDPFGTVLLPLMCIFFHQPIFGYARPTPVNLRNTRRPRLANFWISAAGPLSNVLVAVVSVAVLALLRLGAPEPIRRLAQGELPGGIAAPVAFLLVNFVKINVILAVFNLIPFPPMDGSGILFSLLGRRGMALELFFHRNALVMLLLIFALLYSGAFSLILNPVMGAVFGVLNALLS